jgi:hypothetical protein
MFDPNLPIREESLGIGGEDAGSGDHQIRSQLALGDSG